MSNWVWLDEPPPRGAAHWEQVAQNLRANEGKWVLLFEQASYSIARAMAQGNIVALADDGFRVVTRNHTTPAERQQGRPRLCDIYVSYKPKTDIPKRRSAPRVTKTDDGGTADG